MTALTISLESDLHVFHEAARVEPVRPGAFQQLPDDRHLKAVPRRSQKGADDIARKFDDWLALAKREAENAMRVAESFPESAAGWVRAAYAQSAVGDVELAREAVWRAIDLVTAREDVEDWDVPALYGAVSVLASNDLQDDLRRVVAKLPDSNSLRSILATILARLDDRDGALAQIPRGDESLSGLAGYLRLLNGEFHGAIRDLRSALRHNSRDVASWVNLSLALRGAGSIRKAIRAAAAATRVAPGRVDAQSIYLELLAASGQWSIMASEVARLESSDVVPDAHFYLTKARLAAKRNETSQMEFFLRKAERLATEFNDVRLAAELRANIAMVVFAQGRASKTVTLQKLREVLGTAPDSVSIADMLATISSERHDVRALIPLVAMHADKRSNGAFSLRTKTAYLQGAWDRCLAEATEWVKMYPRSDEAMMSYLSVVGHLDNDWTSAASAARGALKTHYVTPLLINQAAYSLAMARASGEALQALERTSEWNFRLEATRGLALLANGSIDAGLKLYASAADMIADRRDAENSDVLLRIHLAMGLRWFDLASEEVRNEVDRRGLALTGLPERWDDLPAFRALEHRAHLNGWEWPLRG